MGGGVKNPTIAGSVSLTVRFPTWHGRKFASMMVASSL